MQFHIKVYRPADGVSSLTLQAGDRAQAERQAQAHGYQIIAIRRCWYSLPSLKLTGWGFTARFSVSLFSQELLSLLEAGLSLVEAIDILERKAKDAEGRRVLAHLNARLAEGCAFSRALETLPGIFPILFVATVRAAEQTGGVSTALRRYLDYHQQMTRIRDKVISASVYPALLLVVGTLVVLFLLGYVVPRFSLVYQDLGNDLPWLSKMLMAWGQWVSQHGVHFRLGVLVLLALIVAGLGRSGLRATIMRSLWSLPVVGEKMRVYELARFTRMLGMLIQCGIPFVSAMEMVGGLLKQPALKAGLANAVDAIRSGRGLAETFSTEQLATDLGARLLVVGERTGEMGIVLERIARLYDDEIARWVDWFTRLFEPVLMVFVGLAIGLIVLLMYLPIFELAGSIQ